MPKGAPPLPARAEGSPNGTFNENTFFNSWPVPVEDNLRMIDKLGGPDTYGHYPTGWACGFSTPFKMFKRSGEYCGGTNAPMVIHWPKGIRTKGEIRHQYHHVVDVVPTILECCGVERPKVVDGVEQTPQAKADNRREGRENRRSAIGRVKPLDERPVFGLAVGERTDANPPMYVTGLSCSHRRFGMAASTLLVLPVCARNGCPSPAKQS